MDFDLKTIISTKITTPPKRGGMVDRSKLYEELNYNLSKKLTLVSAPAGYGKTTLVTKWIDGKTFPVAWLSLDELDNHPIRFFNYLMAAIMKSTGKENKAFQSIKLRNDEMSIDAIFNDVYQLFKDHSPYTVFVIDDYHIINNPVIHELFFFLLKNLPMSMSPSSDDEGQGIHWIILSRNNPPFQFSKWRLQNNIYEIQVENLRFTHEETTNFINYTHELSLNENEINLLEKVTEGWIAGLQMAVISFKDKKKLSLKTVIDQFVGKNRIVSEYLMEEVFSQQTNEIQQFLLQTSIVNRLSGDLAKCITLINNSHKILDLLEKKNLFVTALDDHGYWFRYHHLFSEFLKDQLNKDGNEKIKILHTRAAEWFDKQGLMEECLFHWLQAEKFDQAARYIARISPDLLNLGQFFMVRDMISELPLNEYEKWPWLPIYQAWVCFMFDPDSVEVWLEHASRMINDEEIKKDYDHQEINEMLGNIAALYSLLGVRLGEVNTTFHYAPIAINLLPKHVNKVRGLVYVALATAELLTGNLEKSLDIGKEAKQILLKGGNIGGSADVLYNMGEIKIIQGKFREAEELFREAISYSESKGEPFGMFTCGSYSGLGKVLFERNKVNEALPLLLKGYEFSKMMGISEQIYCATSLVDTYLNLGNLEIAEHYLYESELTKGNQRINPWHEGQLISSRILLLAAKKDLISIRKMTSDLFIDEVIKNEINKEIIYLVYTQACLNFGDFKSVLRMCEHLKENIVSGSRIYRLVKLLLLESLAYYKLNEITKAEESLSSALNISIDEDFQRLFIGFGNQMLELMTKLLPKMSVSRTKKGNIFTKKIMSALLSDGIREIEVTDLRDIQSLKIGGEQLTAQEIKILKLIEAGQSNQEISETLDISINTVKTHISHLFQKLSVHNRVQAIAIGRKLGI